MDSKKHFASLLEDHSPGPSAAAPRPLSPFRTGPRPDNRSGDGGSTYATPSRPGLDVDLDLNLNRDQSVLSCVTKETSQEDCARHRFIVWAAVKRNSSPRMTPQERLECPLLRCTQRFPDHEAMLKHLAGCRYLAFGEYWCYDHMRVERFDDLKCRRCLGHPSKRRKILHMAKSFFRSLGHKSKKMQGMSSDDGDIMLPPPPSYDSLNIPSVNGRASELPSTEILEIDSMELPLIQAPPMPAPSDVIDPQALIMTVAPPLPELDSTMLSSDAFMQWQPVSAIESPSFPIMTQDDGSVKVPATKPTLQLTTAGLQGRRQSPRPVARPASVVPRSKGLSPSSSVRSTASTDTNASTTSNGSSLISPASNWSGAWSMGSGLNTGMTSPVDGIVADDMFAEASNSYSHDACPNFLHDLVSELPADLPMLDNASDMPSDALLGFNPSSTANVSYNPDIVLTDDVADEVERDEPEIAETNACCSETKSLVCSAWDALQEHVVSSMVKIQDQQGNRLASQLEAMSIKTVATTGLRVLRALINGHQPSSASDALCLIHLVYAFSLVLHEQGIPERFDGLFLQSLTYMNELPPSDRDLYRQLVMSIWQPPGINQARIDHHLASVSGRPFGLSPDPKGKSPQVLDWGFGQSSDSVLAAARDFLDELEMSLLLSHDSLPLEVQVSDLHITHLKDTKPAGLANGALVATTKYVLEMLAQGFSHPRLNDRLEEIYRRLGSGSICSVRRIEIEILHAGKICLPAAKFYGNFVPRTRRLCDQIYGQHDTGPSRRDIYHGLGITLIENLIAEFDSPGVEAAVASPDDIDAFFNDLSSEVDNMGMTVPAAQPSNPRMSDSGDGQIQLPTPGATSSGSPSSTQSASPAAEQPQQPAAGETSEQRRQQQQQKQQQSGQKVEASSCCEICGYRPKGDPQWFKGSMAKHKKLQHSTEPPKIYKCPYPGCTSQYRNRPDNLRQHQIEKNHWVKGDEGTTRRPSKRKKVAEDGD